MASEYRDSGTNPRSYYLNRSWERNGRRRPVSPYNKMWSIQHGPRISDAGNTSADYDLQTEKNFGLALNRALNKLNDKIGESSSLGATLAEGVSSLDMMTKRAATLVKSMRAFRKGDLRGGVNALNVSPLAKHETVSKRTIAKKAGSFWLEYWFGWAPLVNDIHSSARVLVQDQPASRLKARSGYSYTVDNWGEIPTYLNDGLWVFKRTVDIRCEVGADIYVGDPNTALATRLGLNNPLSVAWELIPWSWLIDWVIPVGESINSFNMFKGYTLKNGYTTYVATSNGHAQMYKYHPNGPWGGSEYNVPSFGDSFRMLRRSGVDAYYLNLTPRFSGLSVTRAATAISLLAQNFEATSRRSG